MGPRKLLERTVTALGSFVAECCALPEAVWRRAYASKVTDS